MALQLELALPSGFVQFDERRSDDLTNSLAGEAQRLADLLERAFTATVEAKSQLEHEALARRKTVQE